jgi:hypothetical protein
MRTIGPENWVVGSLSLVSLLMFFFPLVSIQAPIVGGITFSGYDIVSKRSEVKQRLVPTPGGGAQSTQPTQSDAPKESMRLSLAMKTAGFIPLSIALAMICAFLALAGSMQDLRVARITSTVGAALGLVAIVHITVLGSDVRNMLREVLTESGRDLEGNPFAKLAQSLGDLMVNAFQLKPGGGLYVLTGALLVAAIVGQSRVLARLRFVETNP